MLDSKIHTFLAVVELKSYTAAANLLHMTQPAVTQHIKKLEEYYGCKLIDTSHHSIKPTKAGELLYEYLALQQANEQQFSGLLNNVIEPLRIGTTLSIADYYMPKRIIKYFLSTSQRMRVAVGNTPYLMELLQKGKLDCAFIEGIFDKTLLETRVFHNADFCAVVASSHPLAEKVKRVDLEALHQYPLVLREPNSGTREVFENWLKGKNDVTQAFSQVIEMGSFVMIKELVKSSQAVTFLYEGVVEKELESGELSKLCINDFELSHPLMFVFRKGDPRRGRLLEFYEGLF